MIRVFIGYDDNEKVAFSVLSHSLLKHATQPIAITPIRLQNIKDIFVRDNGYGRLMYRGSDVGSINYETGALDWTISSCPNAEFVFSALYNSPLSGKQDATDSAKINSLIEVLGNTPQQKGNAVLKVETF